MEQYHLDWNERSPYTKYIYPLSREQKYLESEFALAFLRVRFSYLVKMTRSFR